MVVMPREVLEVPESAFVHGFRNVLGAYLGLARSGSNGGLLADGGNATLFDTSRLEVADGLLELQSLMAHLLGCGREFL